MKNIFLLLCLCCSVALSAQSSKRSVSETSTDNTYAFSIKLDRDRGDELSSAYLKLVSQAGNPAGVSKIVGTAEMTTANGTIVRINTKGASLKVISAEDNASSIAEAKRYVTFLRQELNVAPAPAAPTPPTPPKINE